jgi:hypothetical protein
MATHHGRPGGRATELLLLLLTLLASVVLIVGGAILSGALSQATGLGSPSFMGKAGGVLGCFLSALLWRKLLAYHRYGPDLMPIRSEEDKT